ncbi:NAD-dependent epimerase/dehydratase family protein [Deltaproteobacteria bacterium TL4]
MNTTPLLGPLLITGANGFIGRYLIKRLVSENHQVRALVLPGEITDPTWNRQVEIYRGDITQPETLGPAFEGVQTVFHLASVVTDWGKESLFQAVTVEGTRNIMNRSAEVQARVVLISSFVVYGDALLLDLCTEDHPYGKPLGPYSRSKQQQEQVALEIADKRKVALSIIRPTNVFGPGSLLWVDEVVKQLQWGVPVLVGFKAKNAGLCYVDHVVDIMIRAASMPIAVGRIYNASDGSEITWKRYFSDLAKLSGAPRPKFIPWHMAKLSAEACEKIWNVLELKQRPPLTLEALNLVGSNHRVPITRALEELDYKPLNTYRESMQDVGQYIQEKGLNKKRKR